MLSPDEVTYLLSELCVKLGFCDALDDEVRLQGDPSADIDAFTDAVFAAEGLDPAMPAHRPLRRQVRALVAKAFERE